MNRRQFLELCGITAGAGLIGSAWAGHDRRSTVQPRRLIVVFAVGGWDTAYALDPKLQDHVDIPAGATQTFAGLDIFTDPSRPAVTEYFTRHAASTALIRGIATDAITHNECQRRIATGTREETRPDLGAIVAHELGDDLPLPYLILGEVAFTGPYAASAGRVGTTNQIVELLGHGPTGETPQVAPGAHHAPTLAEDRLLRDYHQAAAQRARATRGALGHNRRRVDDFSSSIERALRLRGLHDRFGVRGEVRTMEAQATLALDALEQDISHAVMLTTACGWDTHGDNHLQADFHQITFAALTHLVDGLITRPGRAAGTRMIDDTVVVCLSEMSRAPRLGGGDPAHYGKDHWPVTAAMVIGAGVDGGRIYGATTPETDAIPVDFSTGAAGPDGTKLLYTNFIAGVLALCGVDPSAHFANASVFDAFIA